MADDDFSTGDSNVEDDPIENKNPYVLKSAFYSCKMSVKCYRIHKVNAWTRRKKCIPSHLYVKLLSCICYKMPL